MTPFEWLALAYFAAVALAAPRRGPAAWRGPAFAAAAIALVIVARFLLPWPLRLWMPHAYLLLGYWIPAAFTPAPAGDGFERWLRRADGWLASKIPVLPRVRRGRLEPAFELAYLLCYPLVPAAFLAVYVWGTPRDAGRFWVAVLSAGYACYGTLPWTVARPPRLADVRPPAGWLARLNAGILGMVSHRSNTFPSGHVAVAVAAAIAVTPVAPVAGAAVGALGAAIAVAAVAGRYHYLVDVLLGGAVGAVAGGLTVWWPFA